MAQTTITATFDEQCLFQGGVESEIEENPTYVGHNASSGNAAIYRNVMSFPTTSITSSAIPSLAELLLNVVDVNGMTGKSVFIGGYNGNGQGNPSTDSAAQAYARCNVSADHYGSFTDFQSTGAKTLALGVTVNADLQACIAAQVPFVVAVQIDGESGLTQNNAGWDSVENATNKPQLRVTYTTPVAAFGLGRSGKQYHQLLAR